LYLQSLHLINFKNYTEAELDFSEKINCFVGNNGEGKTNLLDAIYYLSFTKSYFTTIDQQNIRHGEDFFAIHGTFNRNGTPDQVSCIQKLNQKKIFRLNKKDLNRFSDHIGQFPCVLVSPYDRDLINEGSEVRRRFIDSVISQFDRLYFENLMRYNRLLEQRNVLLKQFAENRWADNGMIGIIDGQMIPLAQNIHEKRKVFLQAFIGIFGHYFEFISGKNEEVNIIYDSQLNEGNLNQLLLDSFEKDCVVRYSTTGIHKDDLIFNIGEFPVKRYGSQGQQKSFVVALRLAQFDFTRKLVGYNPLLLFDDIFDKLDPLRVRQLVELVGNENFGQVFITDTEPARIHAIFDNMTIDHRVFLIEEGKVRVSR
jgi:DNA replication and repair protein RecF